ncbi:hypothetical protein P152DRAFT_471921 [Eremomyces bilateralis CBS 781.70]|uniref:Uncharacterized protein n=1 Tax=Eremomyces bilateralis CBS 781.70 TaxID=1392243 RepID=A0A6G1G8A7_9PEZI|nr:uncharacterized protein P152DRAFT_471921 [Eremomyces bilateralis CBS 781.70]KAF1814130.1 hypothetical protein P152DRAFT_471921 [Eremomyces bilateralis CBS 781.70]
MAMPANQTQAGPPYLPQVWSLGGVAKDTPDLAASGAFLGLFILGAAAHMLIHRANKKKGKRFGISHFIFGFCCARISTLVLRILVVKNPTSVGTAIAAQVLILSGVLLLFIVNLIFARRIIRAQHPRLGWHRTVSAGFIALFVLIGATLAATVAVTVLMFYTLNPDTRRAARGVQLYAATFLAVVATLPMLMMLLGVVLPRRTRVDKFGEGRFRTKVLVVLSASMLLSFGAWYRALTSYIDPVPRSEPLPGYFGKAPFYIVIFGVEIVVVWLYFFLRIDKRFRTPDGAKGPGSYAAGQGLTPPKPGSDIIYTELGSVEDQYHRRGAF